MPSLIYSAQHNSYIDKTGFCNNVWSPARGDGWAGKWLVNAQYYYEWYI